MTTSITNARRSAFNRLFGLAAWTQAQSEPFSFEDVRDTFPKDYVGSFDAVDRAWTRDKQRLAVLGLRLEHLFDGYYMVAEGCRSRRVQGDPTARLERQSGLNRALGVAYALLVALQEAGPNGLDLATARRRAGARDEAELLAAFRDLERVVLPLEPPRDAIGVTLEGGRLFAYSSLVYVSPLVPPQFNAAPASSCPVEVAA